MIILFTCYYFILGVFITLYFMDYGIGLWEKKWDNYFVARNKTLFPLVWEYWALPLISKVRDLKAIFVHFLILIEWIRYSSQIFLLVALVMKSWFIEKHLEWSGRFGLVQWTHCLWYENRCSNFNPVISLATVAFEMVLSCFWSFFSTTWSFVVRIT